MCCLQVLLTERPGHVGQPRDRQVALAASAILDLLCVEQSQAAQAIRLGLEAQVLLHAAYDVQGLGEPVLDHLVTVNALLLQPLAALFGTCISLQLAADLVQLHVRVKRRQLGFKPVQLRLPLGIRVPERVECLLELLVVFDVAYRRVNTLIPGLVHLHEELFVQLIDVLIKTSYLFFLCDELLLKPVLLSVGFLKLPFKPSDDKIICLTVVRLLDLAVIVVFGFLRLLYFFLHSLSIKHLPEQVGILRVTDGLKCRFLIRAGHYTFDFGLNFLNQLL